MEIIGIILMVVGGLLSVIYSFVLLIKAFQASFLWGLGCILFPIVGLIFIIMNWEETSSAFWKTLLGSILFAIGSFLIMANVAPTAG